jgi:hypothetical protein
MTEDFIQFGGVQVSAVGACEIYENQMIRFIPASEIVGIDLVHRAGADHPMIVATLGFILLGLSMVPIIMLFDTLNGGHDFFIRWIYMLGLVFPAAWILDLGLRKRWVLLVQTRKGVRKLIFKSKDVEELDRFIVDARTRFGYSCASLDGFYELG